MGLYDDLQCRCPLPDGTVSDEWFQTKGFGCTMAQHEIAEDGTLMLDVGENIEVFLEDRPFPNAGPFMQLIGSEEHVRRLEPQIEFTGAASFYSESGEFVAVWLDGKLMGIRRQGGLQG